MGLNTYKIEVGFNLQENNKHYWKAVNIPSGCLFRYVLVGIFS